MKSFYVYIPVAMMKEKKRRRNLEKIAIVNVSIVI